MEAVVIGGGVSGQAIRYALTMHGVRVRVLSRSSGFNVLTDDAVRALGAADAVVEATGTQAMSRKAATEFFTESTRRIGDGAQQTGTHHIVLSIVNCDHPDVQGLGYYAAKATQEQVARAHGATIVRSTQWFEFAAQIVSRARLGPLGIVPSMTMRPVALDAVADVIAECVTGERAEAGYDVAGPQIMTLWDLAGRTGSRPRLAIPLAVPGRTGRAFRDGTITGGSDVELVGPDLDEWLARRNTA